MLIRFKPWESSPEQFEEYRREGIFFAAIIADPECPEGFRRLFDATWADELLGSVTDKLGGPYLLPLVYAVVRDAMDASNLCGTADGVYRALMRAVETLVPDEVADRARAQSQEGK